ncbi:MAG: YgiT-type zinc finger protein [Desulfobacterales bacterium]|nr:YgiT-type zinc finger protein [Desulfobacterales bacterium]
MLIESAAPEIDWIREKVRSAHYQISEHVIKFLMAGLLTVPQMETALLTGQVVEIRRHPKRGDSALVRGNAQDKTILVLCAKGHDKWLIISLAYLTVHPEWAELQCAKPYGGKSMENPYRKCFFCGGDIDSITIGNFDYRLEGKLYVIKNTPAGLCLQCGEKYVTAATAKKINALIEAGEFSGTEEVRVMQYS